MQNRFKFRAWNKLSNEMKDVISLNINHSFPDCSNVILETNTFDNIKTHNNPITCANGLNNVVLMQCTGLKDKNGRLIYEGDIVNYDDRDIFPFHTPILNAVIEMRKYQWCMVYHRKDIVNVYTREPAEQKTWLGFDDFITSRIEVIGNIYENPGLLEGKND